MEVSFIFKVINFISLEVSFIFFEMSFLFQELKFIFVELNPIFAKINVYSAEIRFSFSTLNPNFTQKVFDSVQFKPERPFQMLKASADEGNIHSRGSYDVKDAAYVPLHYAVGPNSAAFHAPLCSQAASFGTVLVRWL
jgi:hypothetical protein